MSLDIVVYRAGTPWATPWEEAFIEGLNAHGIDHEVRLQHNRRVSDLAVIWAHRQVPLFQMQREAGKHYLVMERGYVGDRFKWTSLGYDGLNGHADFCNHKSPPDRWRRYFGSMLRPWKYRTDGYVLLIGQIPGDASLKGVDHPAWLRETAAELKAMGEAVRFRPHPVAMERANGNAAQVYGDMPEPSTRSLAEDLAGAKYAITWNSNTGVDAALAGVPVVAMDKGSMAWAVSSHELGEIEMPDRDSWCAGLAFCQWSEAEIRSGEAWAHLRKKFKA